MKKTSVSIKTRDVAFPFRMGAGFAGDVNRTHPFSVSPSLVAAATPFLSYGTAAVMNSTGNYARPIAASEASDSVAIAVEGFLVRPFPSQAAAGSSNAAQGIGAASPPTTGALDFMKSGYIMVQLNDITAAVVKGQRMYIWAAATSGVHIAGGIEAVASSGNTVELDPRYTFNGPADAAGIVEISANV